MSELDSWMCLGSEVTFYAVLTMVDRVRLIPLTSTISCIQSACDGRDRKSLYLAFAAASVLQAHILKDAQNILINPSVASIPDDARLYPAVFRLSKYAAAPGDYLSFEIFGTFGNPDHRIYKARSLETQGQILIKFTQRYSIDLHAFCAQKGHAPSIFGYERLPGGWFAVAMEHVEPSTLITQSENLKYHRDRWTAELERLLDGIHAMDLVHGDLRDVNIICKGDTVMLVDFDWGGQVGEAVYPTFNLNPELLWQRGSDSLKITKEDDKRVLRKTFSKIRNVL